MKKITTLILTIAASMLLAGCGGNTEIDYDTIKVPETEEQAQEAIEVVKDHAIANVKGRSLTPGVESSLSGDDRDAVTLTTKEEARVKNYGTVEVAISWDYDATKYKGIISKIADVKDADGNIDPLHKIMYFEYSEDEDLKAEFTATYTVTLTNGEKVSEKDDAFKVKLNQVHRLYEEHTIESLYEVTEGKYCFLNDKYQIGSNKNLDNVDQGFYYVQVPGKLVYLAADKNFGVMSDGNLSVYLYKINELAQTPEVGKYYNVFAEVGSYKGAIQLTFISRMVELEDHSEIAEPAEPTELTVEAIRGYKQVSDKHMYLTKLSGVKYNGGVTADTNPNKRFTFKVKDGDKEMNISYDYHTKIGAALVEKLKDVETGNPLDIVGRLIYNGSDTFNGNGDKWELLVLSADDITVIPSN